MSANPAQPVDPSTLPVVTEYQFSGDEVTQAKKCAFIEALRMKATVYHAALTARISRKTAYQWYQRDEEFAQAWEDSFEDCVDNLETSVYERALGTNGQRPDPLLAMFWLKAHRPKFRDKMQVDIQVLDDEIRERMNRLNVQQLPAATFSFIEAEAVAGDADGASHEVAHSKQQQQSRASLDQPGNQQKD